MMRHQLHLPMATNMLHQTHWAHQWQLTRQLLQLLQLMQPMCSVRSIQPMQLTQPTRSISQLLRKLSRQSHHRSNAQQWKMSMARCQMASPCPTNRPTRRLRVSQTAALLLTLQHHCRRHRRQLVSEKLRSRMMRSPHGEAETGAAHAVAACHRGTALAPILRVQPAASIRIASGGCSCAGVILTATSITLLPTVRPTMMAK